jgi:hypothetical protein
MLLAGCAPMQMKGVNLLQSRNVAIDDPRSVANMQHLKVLGANTIALVPFLRQTAVGGCELSVDEHYSMPRLRNAIAYAHDAGLHVVLKPQILVQDSWAGEINQLDEAGWKCWFDAYAQQLIPLARVANDTNVEMLVIGTELSKTQHRAEWRDLAGELRTHYRGKLSYVAHDIEELASFAALDKMDSVAVTYYPKLNGQDMRAQMKALAVDMKRFSEKLHKPFWFAEIGITSRQGALENPWLWPEQTGGDVVADPELQARVLDGWLEELTGEWNLGVLIWNWYSDADAGGLTDVDFTIQNKPAEQVVSCHWQKRCH